jgi:hypothetical protein
VGPVRAERAYYYCADCRQGHYPWDEVLGTSATELTPAATEITTLAGILTSFEEARAKVLPRMAGLRLAESTVERITEGVGQRLKKQRATGQIYGAAVPWKWHRDATGQTCAYVSLDATGVGQQGPGARAAEGRMAYVGMIFNPPRPEESTAGSSQARYLAGLYDLKELGPQMRRQGAQVGMDQADHWIALTDGGNGLEEFLRVYFPRAECILDFYHAAEHVNDLSKAWYADEERARTQAQAWCHTLKHEGGQALLAQLQDLDLRGKSATTREVHRQVTQYVANQCHRMDYPRYRAHGWLIGSGHVESACKTVVGARLKGSGMRWSEEGADAVCHLRALFKSQASQWDAFWHPSVN